MKKTIILLVLLAVSTGLHAQGNSDWGWPQAHSSDQINIDKNNHNISIDRSTYVWRPFDDVVGYSIYGSRYRKAKANLGWGKTITFLGGAASGIWLGIGISNIGWDDEAAAVMCSTGAIALAGSLWGGIRLWSKGRKDMDRMLDDYARRYAPKPYASSLDFGATSNGFGFALKF